jgi:hypothetical protein
MPTSWVPQLCWLEDIPKTWSPTPWGLTFLSPAHPRQYFGNAPPLGFILHVRFLSALVQWKEISDGALRTVRPMVQGITRIYVLHSALHTVNPCSRTYPEFKYNSQLLPQVVHLFWLTPWTWCIAYLEISFALSPATLIHNDHTRWNLHVLLHSKPYWCEPDLLRIGHQSTIENHNIKQ